jgi:hypothetical protein
VNPKGRMREAVDAVRAAATPQRIGVAVATTAGACALEAISKGAFGVSIPVLGWLVRNVAAIALVQVNLPLFALAALAALSVVALVPMARRARGQLSLSRYTTDELDGIRCCWKWSRHGPRSLTLRCAQCLSLLRSLELKQVSGLPCTMLSCLSEGCLETSVILNGKRELLEREFLYTIDAQVASGKWSESVRRDSSIRSRCKVSPLPVRHSGVLKASVGNLPGIVATDVPDANAGA